MSRQVVIERAFRLACAEELAAPKPGNVGLHAAGHRMTVGDFQRSADVAASRLCAPGVPLGQRILTAVQATRAAVGQNTNLGIILLGAPLAMAAETAGASLQPALVQVLEQADLADAEAVFRAITEASPGGLGDAPKYDVRGPARVQLAVAMAEAAGRDRIAWQWTHAFADIFGLGLASYAAAAARWTDPPWAALAVYLRFLASFPDSHILRKFGPDQAEQIRAEAIPMEQRLLAETHPERLVPELLAWDAALKDREINPGTSADLTVATIFAHNLLKALRAAGNDG
jgi:triphosphoribosyl-dephospho-CoA synthase